MNGHERILKAGVTWGVIGLCGALLCAGCAKKAIKAPALPGWQKVAQWDTSKVTDTEPFTITGDQWRIDIQTPPDAPEINVEYSGDARGSYTMPNGSGFVNKPGTFRLHLSGGPGTVTVWDHH